ncbi:MAG: GlxA family transcriptional regulator [Microthrixaceae bacterium]
MHSFMSHSDSAVPSGVDVRSGAGEVGAGVVHRCVIVVYDQLQLMDLAGPLEVLSMVEFLRPGARYESVLVSPNGSAVSTSAGVDIGVSRSFDDELASGEPIDTLLVTGGPGSDAIAADLDALDLLRALAMRARRVASVCTGAFVMAATGLLDGRRVTTHWATCDSLRELYPALEVDGDKIFVVDGRFWSSAGVTAGIDLTLAMVAEDHDDQLAQEVASWLVVFARRPGGQSQFSATLQAQHVGDHSLSDLLGWIPTNLERDLGVPALAARVNMSPRTFARTFAREVGTTPAAHVELVRIEAARTLLATSDLGVDAVARRVGYRRTETMHRAFRRVVGTTPDSYRQHFSRQPA